MGLLSRMADSLAGLKYRATYDYYHPNSPTPMRKPIFGSKPYTPPPLKPNSVTKTTPISPKSQSQNVARKPPVVSPVYDNFSQLARVGGVQQYFVLLPHHFKAYLSYSQNPGILQKGYEYYKNEFLKHINKSYNEEVIAKWYNVLRTMVSQDYRLMITSAVTDEVCGVCNMIVPCRFQNREYVLSVEKGVMAGFLGFQPDRWYEKKEVGTILRNSGKMFS